jgi:hypothetical protein
MLITDITVIESIQSQKVDCMSGVATDTVEEIVTTGHTVLRYDFHSGQFVDNWKTPSNKANACYDVTS